MFSAKGRATREPLLSIITRPSPARSLQAGYIWNWGTGAGTINVNGGSFNCTGQLTLGYCDDGEGRYGVPTTGIVNVTAGKLTAGLIYLGGCDNSQSFTGGYGAVNISGSGVVATGGIMSDAVSGNGPYFAYLGEQVNFDSGTLRAMSSNAAFINPNGCTNFHVRINAGGATIDSNGFDIGLPLALEAGTTTGGGLTKIGTGNLTLANANTYTGPTNINAGQLNLLTGTPFTGRRRIRLTLTQAPRLGVVLWRRHPQLHGHRHKHQRGVCRQRALRARRPMASGTPPICRSTT